MTTDYAQRLSTYNVAKKLAEPTNDSASVQLQELRLLYEVGTLCPDGTMAKQLYNPLRNCCAQFRASHMQFNEWVSAASALIRQVPAKR